MNKYKAKKCTYFGVTFDSKAEGARYLQLRSMEQSGEIERLRLQVSYKLVVNGELICKYKSDFDYIIVKTGEIITEDVKGMILPVFRLKAKLFKALFGREIKIVKMK